MTTESKVIANVADSLVNYNAQLGTKRDKAAGSFYVPQVLTDFQAVASYLADWLPSKIVNLPPWDATREWRAWQTDREQIGLLESEEKRLGLQGKLCEAMQAARLRGGHALFIGTGDRDPIKPLDPSRIKRGGLQYLTLVNKRNIQAGPLENDVLSPDYGSPQYFTIGGNAVRVHPSRLIIFRGEVAPGDDGADGVIADWWGGSILDKVMTACLRADSTLANVASLVFEAKVDVVRVPNFLQHVANPRERNQLLEMASLNAMAKGVNGMLMIDAEMEYQSKNASFGGLPDVMDRFLQVAAGAADIPLTRLLGQSPGGLNSTGESDLRNYYDHVKSIQSLVLQPRLDILDECLIRSALGSRPDDIYYTWRPLWQPTAEQAADIGHKTAQTIKLLSETRLFNPDALSRAAATALTEREVLPGLETAIDDLGEEDPMADPDADADRTGKTSLEDAAPRSMYVSRKVRNAKDILEWAQKQGIPNLMPAEELHVTVARSRTPVDWLKMGSDWNSTLVIEAGGPRVVEKMGDATVLSFASLQLKNRNESMRERGASWDFEDYTPHISVTYTENDLDVATIKPYTGPIELGPEIFEEVRNGAPES